ncbi:Protein-disulfide isomerase [Poseidonocella pacifica]|uniref:Protein-disulfide isomerase n=1 Tax=Poseidonocella pacifica TaxID=871651 RepID=A0A1I0WMP8_9RHOB|nr:DsbA family protein [Poseidonocella pacifica]SFA89273.1 Protein-disulfide isomerase [Poseidonocella pacifica]
MSRSLLISVIVAALVAFGAFWLTSTPKQLSGLEAYQPGGANAQESPAEIADVTEMQIGNPDADVTVIEYASFTCPHCANFHENVYPQLKADYIDSGKINFIYREVYFDAPGLWGSLVARCGGEMRFFGIAGMLYERQKEWLASGDRAVIETELRKIGKIAGLSDDQLNACLSDADNATNMVAWFQANSQEHNIRSTPSFVVNGKTYQNMPYAEFRELLDDELGE